MSVKNKQVLNSEFKFRECCDTREKIKNLINILLSILLLSRNNNFLQATTYNGLHIELVIDGCATGPDIRKYMYGMYTVDCIGILYICLLINLSFSLLKRCA